MYLIRESTKSTKSESSSTSVVYTMRAIKWQMLLSCFRNQVCIAWLLDYKHCVLQVRMVVSAWDVVTSWTQGGGYTGSDPARIALAPHLLGTGHIYDGGTQKPYSETCVQEENVVFDERKRKLKCVQTSGRSGIQSCGDVRYHML